MARRTISFFALLLTLACSSASSEPTAPSGGAQGGHDAAPQPEPHPKKGAPSDPIAPVAPESPPSEQAAYERARPVFDKHCARCHASDGPKATKGALSHFDMSSYPFGGHHAGELGTVIPDVLGVGGKKARMPKDDPGAVKGEELDAVITWARTFHPPEPEHPHHH